MVIALTEVRGHECVLARLLPAWKRQCHYGTKPKESRVHNTQLNLVILARETNLQVASSLFSPERRVTSVRSVPFLKPASHRPACEQPHTLES